MDVAAKAIGRAGGGVEWARPIAAVRVAFGLGLGLVTVAVWLSGDWSSWFLHALQIGAGVLIVHAALHSVGRIALRATLLVAAIGLPVLALLQRVGALRELGLPRAWQPTLWMDNPNILAGSIAVLALAALVVLHRRGWIHALPLVLVPAGVVILILGSRTAMVTLLLGLVVASALLRPLRALLMSLSLSLAAGMLVVGLLLVVAPAGQRIMHPWVFQQFDVAWVLGGDSTSLSSRAEARAVAWEMFRSAPLGGAGQNGFAVAFRVARPDMPVIFHAHSAPLQLLATLGVFGTAGWLIVLVLPAAFAIRRDPRHVMPVVVAIAAANLTEYSLFWFAVYGSFWIVVGLALGEAVPSGARRGQLDSRASTATLR